MNEPRLILLHGLPRAGKDTVGDYLKHSGYIGYAFGDAIYDEVSKAFGVTVSDLRSDSWKRAATHELALEKCKDKAFALRMQEIETPERLGVTRRLDGAILDKPRTSRYVLQRWATEYRRKDDPLYWISLVMNPVYKLAPKRDIVITDLREVPEYKALERYSNIAEIPMTVIEIVSKRSVKTEHSSDIRLPSELINVTINNDGSIPELFSAVQTVMKETQK